ncbi:MAG: PRC and DUF2382 domain-containing protein [Cryobacterium sp.]
MAVTADLITVRVGPKRNGTLLQQLPTHDKRKVHMMIDSKSLNNLIGADVRDPDDGKIGTIGQVYIDQVDGSPRWVSVRTGLFGVSESFIPLNQADWTGNDLRVPYDKKFVKDAPRIDVEADRALTDVEERELYHHYGLDYAADAADAADQTGTRTGKQTDDAMTRSEEQLRVGKESVQTGRVRLHKYVVTEQQNVTVPVSHEEVRVEREPITDANRQDAMSGHDLAEDEVEVTLSAERPVVEKETVPVEQVRLDKDTVTEEARIAADIRKEKVDVEGDRTASGRPQTQDGRRDTD